MKKIFFILPFFYSTRKAQFDKIERFFETNILILLSTYPVQIKLIQKKTARQNELSGESFIINRYFGCNRGICKKIAIFVTIKLYQTKINTLTLWTTRIRTALYGLICFDSSLCWWSLWPSTSTVATYSSPTQVTHWLWPKRTSRIYVSTSLRSFNRKSYTKKETT